MISRPKSIFSSSSSRFDNCLCQIRAAGDLFSSVCRNFVNDEVYDLSRILIGFIQISCNCGIPVSIRIKSLLNKFSPFISHAIDQNRTRIIIRVFKNMRNFIHIVGEGRNLNSFQSRYSAIFILISQGVIWIAFSHNLRLIKRQILKQIIFAREALNHITGKDCTHGTMHTFTRSYTHSEFTIVIHRCGKITERRRATKSITKVAVRSLLQRLTKVQAILIKYAFNIFQAHLE
ncbi:hypothetical protein HMPREF9061_00556 [Actinomyces sp. oral taxon 181 str. F0379]|nr:hypothetical protein HMPREF9061_00556 [Actinomyces sp. oral taxon 181 str. F0379]